jgi:AcrR family transcriptional regulator
MPDHAAPPAPDGAAPTTRDALLAAAREEFAEHGIAGARVNRIAGRAGVNKERIYGYFGSKEKLFDAVMKDALDELAEITAGLGDDPAEYVARLFDHHRRHPALLRLLMWEGLYDRQGELPEQRWRVERCRGAVASLAARLGREPSPEIGRLLLSLTALAVMPLAMPQLGRLMVAEVDDEESAALTREHLVAFVRTAVRGASTTTGRD